MATLQFSTWVADHICFQSTSGYVGLFGGIGNSMSNYVGQLTPIFGAYTTSTGPWVGKLNIYKGTIPTFSTFTNVSSRSTDLLIQFTNQGSTAVSSSLVTVGGVQYWRGTTPNTQFASATASASGTAAWFCVYSNVYTGDLTRTPAMIGTVGTSGSGADLIIGTTTITSGQSYSVGSFVLNFPLVWNL